MEGFFFFKNLESGGDDDDVYEGGSVLCIIVSQSVGHHTHTHTKKNVFFRVVFLVYMSKTYSFFFIHAGRVDARPRPTPPPPPRLLLLLYEGNPPIGADCGGGGWRYC